MAKQKTKEIPFSKKATEVKPGVWEWECGGLTWRWVDAPGLNLMVVSGGGQVVRQAFVKNLREAGLFAEGTLNGIVNGQMLTNMDRLGDEYGLEF